MKGGTCVGSVRVTVTSQLAASWACKHRARSSDAVAFADPGVGRSAGDWSAERPGPVARAGIALARPSIQSRACS